jgi:hypothetical protein
MTETCMPQMIVDTLEAIDNNADKIHYIENILAQCGDSACEAPSIDAKIENFLPKSTKQAKRKRKMSGYNCFVKTEVKKGRVFSEVVQSRDWAGLNDKARQNWNLLAEKGCPDYLWDKNIKIEKLL